MPASKGGLQQCKAVHALVDVLSGGCPWAPDGEGQREWLPPGYVQGVVPFYPIDRAFDRWMQNSGRTYSATAVLDTTAVQLCIIHGSYKQTDETLEKSPTAEEKMQETATRRTSDRDRCLKTGSLMSRLV